MKKYILALCAAFLLALSTNALAATPEAEVLSIEQQGAQKWMDTMLVKSDYKAARSQMSAEGQKGINEKQMKEKQDAIRKTLGKMQKYQFNAWVRLGNYDRIVYAAQFEKHPLVRCDIIVNQKGQVADFGLAPVQQQTKQDAGDAKDKQTNKK